MTARLAAALRAIRHLRGKRVFCWGDGSRWTLTTMRTGLARQEKRAGLRVTGWHALRHTFCSRLATKRAPAIVIKTLAGHSSVAVTNRHMHGDDETERSAITLLEGPSWQRGNDLVAK
jgi:integrase